MFLKLLGVCSVVLLALVIAGAVHRTPATPSALGLVTQLNTYRQSKNLLTLAETPELDASANAKCNDIQTNHYFAHDSPTRTWESFLPYHYKQGETLNQGFYGPTANLKAWETSPEHNAILLGDYNKVGLANCTGPEGQVYVAHFAQTAPF